MILRTRTRKSYRIWFRPTSGISSCGISHGKIISVNWLLCYRFFVIILTGCVLRVYPVLGLHLRPEPGRTNLQVRRRIKEIMVQLQTFTQSDYLLKNNCFDNNSLQNWKKKWEKIISFLWIKQKYNFKILRTCSDCSEWFLRRPPIAGIFLAI